MVGTALPDVHVAVVSSDTGPGEFERPAVTARSAAMAGRSGHAALSDRRRPHPSQTTCRRLDNQKVKNYNGDIADAFSCIAALGDQGCGFEGQLKSVRWALDPFNLPAGERRLPAPGGGTRGHLVTNEDDCSVPDESDLIDPTQRADGDPLGPFWSCRCNEFGHLCQTSTARWQPPPRAAADQPEGCVSNDIQTPRRRLRTDCSPKSATRSRSSKGSRPIRPDLRRGDHRAADALRRRT